MADSKISQLSAITTLDGTEEFVVADSGATKRITADDVTAAVSFWDDTIVKAVTESVSGSTTLQDDNELLFAVVQDSPYLFEAILAVDEPVNSGTPDFKFAWSLGGADPGASFSVRSTTYENTAGAVAETLNRDLTTVITAGAAGRPRVIHVRVTTTPSANGTLVLQWAQNTSSPNATRLLAGSWLRYRRLV